MAESRVKICGLTRAEDALCAVEAGASYLGFVFAPSPRRVTAEQILPWLDPLREAVELVGVFRDQDLEFVRRTQELLDLDLVQLHGSERGDEWLELPVRLVAARSVGDAGLDPERFGGLAWAEILDTASAQGGGSGRSFDWELAVEPARRKRIFLAGGLDAENVGQAIDRVRPFAVDVSSGVESAPGVKDPQKLREFCAAVRRS
jgi:phosphoribosylanthranilate isomerase